MRGASSPMDFFSGRADHFLIVTSAVFFVSASFSVSVSFLVYTVPEGNHTLRLQTAFFPVCVEQKDS